PACGPRYSLSLSLRPRSNRYMQESYEPDSNLFDHGKSKSARAELFDTRQALRRLGEGRPLNTSDSKLDSFVENFSVTPRAHGNRASSEPVSIRLFRIVGHS